MVTDGQTIIKICLHYVNLRLYNPVQPYSIWEESYHIPEEIGDPVDSRVNAADKLQMLAVGNSLLDQKQHKAGWHKRHGEDDTDGHQHVHCIVVSVTTNSH